jgi:hypothetical protein
VDRFERAVAAIDAANAADPHTIVIAGAVRPKEQAHAELMTEWVRRLDPGADEAQLLAARAHHLRRWELPRADFPEGRAGYLRWRAAQKKRHADAVGSILRDVGYDDATVDRVGRIVRKEGLGSDPAVQVHEDALCVVFLATQLTELADRLDDDGRIVEVIRKTAGKMSAEGLAAAMTLDLTDRERALVTNALG